MLTRAKIFNLAITALLALTLASGPLTGTQLRHDFILYGKQTMYPMPIAEGPGLMEPVPETFGRLADLCDQVYDALDGHGMLPEAHGNNLGSLAGKLRAWQGYAQKVSDGDWLSEGEQTDICSIGLWLHGFFADQWEEHVEEKSPMLVADVASDSSTGRVLHEGTGHFNPLIVTYTPPGGEPIAGIGYVFSHYEFAEPDWNRLNDAEWETRLQEDPPPPRPAWASSFLPVFDISKSASSDPIAPGDLLTYTIAVQNLGISDTVEVTITDHIPAGTTFAWADSGGSLVGNQIQWTDKAISLNESLAVSFTVSVTSSLPNGTVITNDDYSVTWADGMSAMGAPVDTTVTSTVQIVKVTPNSSATLHYTDADVFGLDEDRLVLEHWNDDTGTWEEAACGSYERHPEDNWLSAPICHLSRFALLGKEEAYTLTIHEVGNGDVVRTPDQVTYTQDTDVSLTAVPDPDWEFDRWSGDLVTTTNPATIAMNSDKTVTATFTPPTYTLTVYTVGQGEVVKDPDKAAYNYGEVVTLTAYIYSPGYYRFLEWSGDLVTTTNPATITMDSDKVITATFGNPPQIEGGTFTVEPEPPEGGYEPGTIITLTAVSDYCYQFGGWTGDLADYGTESPIVITATTEMSFSAEFDFIVYDTLTVTVEPAGTGLVTLEPASSPYSCGTTITATAKPTTCWAFDHWNGAATGSDNPTYFTLDESSGTILGVHFTQYDFFLPVVLRASVAGQF